MIKKYLLGLVNYREFQETNPSTLDSGFPQTVVKAVKQWLEISHMMEPRPFAS